MKLTGILTIALFLMIVQVNDIFSALIPPFFLDCVVAMGAKPEGALEFSSDEFLNQEKNVQQLCQAINNDNYKLGDIVPNGCSIEWLNRTLLVPDLSDQIICKKANLNLTNEIIELRQQTEQDRKKPFVNLKMNSRNAIKRLNRLMIEKAYPMKSPLSTRWIGTGFLVGSFIEKLDDARKRYYVYLVTNKHVLNEKKYITVRFNHKTDEPAADFDILLQDQQGDSTWIGHPQDAIDVAIIPINTNVLDKEKARYNYFRSDEHILTTDKMAETGISEGDGIFVLGYPMGLVDPAKEYVISRTGSIARIKDVLDKRESNFVADIFVFPGNSGGPIILKPEIVHIEGTKAINRSYLIGMVKAYIPYRDIAISLQTKTPRVLFEENSGLSEIIPSDFIMETINIHRERLQKK